ncbi:hypothetical protein L211DRAFT_558166 [Terfezia boudieri ATCC MYA-4762]|uniref:Uncharacterized protein n=1 Tax=Terfezia boudieri ATCC MYA-4762 TaxID=1051890 RepID=A0A3N4LXJ3_9PEZI|nr:hypothetical protein L211DRAFT_558166 [Terfezia boudieri ATCC MYA-4762]
MPWPAHVIKAFEIAVRNRYIIEAEYYLPYTYIDAPVPTEEGYLVHPQHPRRDDENKLSYIDFTVLSLFDIQKNLSFLLGLSLETQPDWS